MIEAIEQSSAIQRQQHKHRQEIHRKFFPKPPVFPKLPEAAMVKAQEPPAQPEPQPPPQLPLPPRALKLIGLEQTQLRMKIIRRAVCKAFEVTIEDMMGTRRARDIVLPRHVYSYLVTRLTKASLPMIARSLDQDHTTILHAIRRIARKVSIDANFAERVDRLERAIRAELGEYARPRGCTGRYVAHHDVADYLLLGWMWAANLNEYAALLIWPCDCAYVEPRQ